VDTPRRTPLSIRSAERRRWSADLASPDVTGLVLHGIGGIGKSTLAGQIAARLSHLLPERAVTVVTGEVCAASLAAEPTEMDLVVLDDFDDNLSEQPDGWTVRDRALAARLASWPGKLLITCRLPFSLPGQHGQRLVFRHLGPLTRSGAAELALSLPALRGLTESERDRAWRLTAGHPLALEYLDSLLGKGAPFGDAAERVAAAVEVRTGQPWSRTTEWARTGPAARTARSPASTRPAELAEPTELPSAIAEMIALAAGDELFGALFDGLSAGARALLVRASVFRLPVEPGVLVSRVGRARHLAECVAQGLLTASPDAELSVHRWTASELHRRLAEAGRSAELAAAHQHAAGYWRSRAAASPSGERAQLEADYHLACASVLAWDPEPSALPDLAPGSAASASDDAAGLPPGPGLRRRRLRQIGLTSAVAALAAVLAVEAAEGFPAPHLPSTAAPERPSAPSPISQAVAIRNQAAAWVARQVSIGAVVACDPAMCAALVQHGVPAGNLLVLGPGASDPLGSAVVMATAAVRGMFGARLVTVYAPQTLASFGTGQARVDVRAVAPDGALAYRVALAADLRARQVAGLQLLRNRRIALPPAAREELAAGRVDARLLITLAALAVNGPVQVLGFTDDGPGASMGTPLRAAEIVAAGRSGPSMLAFLRAQRAPYLPAQSSLSPAPGGETVLTIEFSAPSPLGLLPAQP
jgi:hypothetical protein